MTTQTPKEGRDTLDALVLTHIQQRRQVTFSVLVHAVPAEYDHREIDRSLQRLRKAKRITFVKGPGAGWRFVQ